jgi:hypothetical protein
MNLLHIVMLVCPLQAATPNDCVLGFETPLVSYEGLEKCTARAEEIYEKVSKDLYQAGAAIRISCVNKKVLEQIKRNVEEERYI